MVQVDEIKEYNEFNILYTTSAYSVFTGLDAILIVGFKTHG